MKAALAVSIWLAGSASAAAGALPPVMAGPVQRCIAAAAGRLDFSGVVLVASAGRLTTYARGVTGGPGSAPITLHTRFNLGSASKMFTAVAVAQLIEAGRVRLDDRIDRYVPGLTPEASAVTIRQLLDHSSGLGNYFTPQNLPLLARARTLSDLLPLVANERPAFPPGVRFAYSDSGYLLLGLLIERVSGESYGEYLQEHVFAPARMTESALIPGGPPAWAVGMTAMPPPIAAPADLARAVHGSPRPAPEAALRGGPAGGAFSTAGDMQRFFKALSLGRLTTTVSLHMLVATQIVASPAQGGQPERDYGFGFGVGRFSGHRWFGHNGGAPGVNAEATVFPEERVIVVVLANRDPPMATAMFRQVRLALFDRC
jgi:CubicO group peptidase (beta-lactamase class C family)